MINYRRPEEVFPFNVFFCLAGLIVLAATMSCSRSSVAPALPQGDVSQPEFFSTLDGGGARNGVDGETQGVSFLYDQAFCAISVQVANSVKLESLAEIPWSDVESLLADLVGTTNARLENIDKAWMVFDRKLVDASMLAGGSSGGAIPMSVVLILKDPVDIETIPRATTDETPVTAKSVFALSQDKWFAAQLDKNIIAIGSEEVLKQTIQGSSFGELAILIQQQPTDRTLTMAIDMRAIAPTINMMADMARQFGAGEEINRMAAITSIQCQADLLAPELLKVVVNVDDREVVDAIAQMINEGLNSSSGGLGGSMGMMNMAGTNRRLEMLTPTIAEPAKAFMDEVKDKGLATTTKTANQIQLTLQRAVSFDRLLASFVTDTQHKLALAQRSGQLDKIAVAMEKFYRDQNRFPSDGNLLGEDNSEGGQFSWRVQILPQLGYQELFDKFRLNEAWDSEHNLKVAEQMPAEYKRQGRSDGNPLATSFRAVNSQGSLFDAANASPLDLDSIKDAKNRTAVIVEVSESGGNIWTAPDATLPDPESARMFGRENEQGVLFIDAEFRVRGIRKQSDTLKSIFSIDGKESINRQDLISIATQERE